MARLDELAAKNANLELLLRPIEPAFCHNDLLPANILDDGEKLWLIDWRYAGWNTPFFDLATLASNAEMPEPQEQGLLETYLRRAIEPEDLVRFAVVSYASLLRESLWSIIQEQHSALDSDFESYTADYLRRFDTAYRDLDFGQ